jgi:inosine-uridine nucleoside N-ribohydrolase
MKQASSGAGTKTPVNVILDTDIGPDCDDAGAIAILHALADRGEATILGMMCCISSPWGARCIHAINSYYGRPGIPIGTLEQSGFLDGEKSHLFNRQVAQDFQDRSKNGCPALGATAAYRRLLADAPDKSVTVTAIGPLINLARLLDSLPDDVVPIAGVDLVRRKVNHVCVMGGVYPEGLEWNFEQDPAAARAVTTSWPTRITFSGFEIGAAIMTGPRLYTETPAANPVRKAYELFTSMKDRQSWDQTTVLCSVRGCRDYWDVERQGTNEVAPDGSNRWIAGPAGNHGYLKQLMDPEGLKVIIEDLMVAPPRQKPVKNQE